MKKAWQVDAKMQNDANNIKKVCAEYIGSADPWLPLTPPDGWNYYHDRSRKIGWCFNPKVIKDDPIIWLNKPIKCKETI